MAKRKQLTLAEVERLGAIIALRRWFILAGLDPVTMRSRLRRGGPELTSEESTLLCLCLDNLNLSHRTSDV